jgi:hypothetical protein
MEKINNLFTVDSVIEEGSYIKVTGVYQIPEGSPFERGDILTEDKYNGHQIYVSFSGKSADSDKDNLMLDTKSMHPKITKELIDIIPGMMLFKIED